MLAREEAVLLLHWGPVLSRVLALVLLWVPVPHGHVQGV